MSSVGWKRLAFSPTGVGVQCATGVVLPGIGWQSSWCVTAGVGELHVGGVWPGVPVLCVMACMPGNSAPSYSFESNVCLLLSVTFLPSLPLRGGALKHSGNPTGRAVFVLEGAGPFRPRLNLTIFGGAFVDIILRG